jgi:cytochrome c oxidase assembly protein subunit 11
MTGLAFAAPPLYDLFCRVTGYGGTTQVADAAPEKIAKETVQVFFDANVQPGVTLEFKPAQRSETIRIGESGLAFYTVKNTSDKPVVAVATYNVTPHATGPFFQKLECFCFEDRVFNPGETMELPVVYFVDPSILESRTARDMRQITLSYTFFAKPEGAPARTADAPQAGRLGDKGDAG